MTFFPSWSKKKQLGNITQAQADKKLGVETAADRREAATGVVTQVENNLYDEEKLRRSLPFVVRLDIETDELKHTASVIVAYNNGLSMKAECFHQPSNVDELINVCVAGAQQCLSAISHEAVFTFGRMVRTVKRKQLMNRKNEPNGFLSHELESDFPRFEFAQPNGAPSIRDVLLGIPQVATDPEMKQTSTGKVKPVKYEVNDPRVAQFQRSLQSKDSMKPRINKEKAKQATNAMAELLRTVGLDDANKK